MKFQPLVLVAIGVVCGLLIAPFLRPDSPDDAAALVSNDAERANSSAGNSSDQQLRIATLTEELEAATKKLAASSEERVKRSAEEFLTSRGPEQNAVLVAAKQREIESLTRAGFSTERIEWVRRRTEELLVKQQQELEENKAKGAKYDPYKSLTYMLDADLDLRLEMGDAEYDKYRRALGRPNGVGVASILATSNAESAGLQPGDEIVSYDGKRVYNQPMLDGFAAARTSDVPAIIEVKRNGQTMFLSIPKGRVGIRNVNLLTGTGGRTPEYVK